MGFLSFAWSDGVFCLKLDFGFFRPRKPKKKLVGPKPLPPPFPLPPLHVPPPPVELLIDAPALKGTHVIRGYTQEKPVVVCEPTRMAPNAEVTMIDADDELPTSENTGAQRRAVRAALRDLTLTDL